MMQTMLPPEFPHVTTLSPHVEVDGFTFQDPNQPAMDFDFDNDDDAAKDIDDFTSLLASIDDEETARDIDDFATLMNVLSKSQESSDADMSDVSIDDLLSEPAFAEKVNVTAILGTQNNVTMDDESEYDSDDDDDDDLVAQSPVHSAAQKFLAPIDPRCCIQSPIFKTIDSRIPMINLPKMDVSFGRVLLPVAASVKPSTTPLSRSSSIVTSPSSPALSASSADSSDVGYVHDTDKCWVCKCNKSEERKRVLHRYVEKRYRRNWKRGARYTARSRVASSRVREGGRFVTKCEWVAAADYN
ncbi:hypothetical protein DYB30_008012 [Aphanomyces astaci]|uniref:CCT domain-containing protein n=1 Tax=Aphanomyces astaci TaxID=112090 RepID=A0A397CJ71_APHAT|nr:hypothetical protein DYB30_008012 [Aphanomyces astaci]